MASRKKERRKEDVFYNCKRLHIKNTLLHNDRKVEISSDKTHRNYN